MRASVGLSESLNKMGGGEKKEKREKEEEEELGGKRERGEGI